MLSGSVGRKVVARRVSVECPEFILTVRGFYFYGIPVKLRLIFSKNRTHVLSVQCS